MKFIESVFDIDCMTERDCQADNMHGAFDFDQEVDADERKLIIPERNCHVKPEEVEAVD